MKYNYCPNCGTQDITNDGVCFHCGDMAYLNPWISVEERLPEGDQQVIAYHSAWGVEITQWYQNRWRYIGLGEDEPTHWIPLPNPPKE